MECHLGRNTFSFLSLFYLKLEFKRVTTEAILTTPVTWTNCDKYMSKIANLTAPSAHEPVWHWFLQTLAWHLSSWGTAAGGLVTRWKAICALGLGLTMSVRLKGYGALGQDHVHLEPVPHACSIPRESASEDRWGFQDLGC